MSQRLLFLMIAIAGVVAAQDPPTRIGRLNYVSGSVSFQPGGVDDWVPATINRPLTVGDQLYADAGARAEIQVPGTVFRLGSTTAFEFLNLDDRNTQVRLSEGALDVRVRRLKDNLEVDSNSCVHYHPPGRLSHRHYSQYLRDLCDGAKWGRSSDRQCRDI